MTLYACQNRLINHGTEEFLAGFQSYFKSLLERGIKSWEAEKVRDNNSTTHSFSMLHGRLKWQRGRGIMKVLQDFWQSRSHFVAC